MRPGAKTDEANAGPNHPLATRMAAIGFVMTNVTLASLFGSFSVLLLSVEKHLGVGRELSTLGIPLATLGTALTAPVFGHLAAKVSLRLLMVLGSTLSTIGYLLLATTASAPLYLAAYGLFLGPGMAAAVILAASLVTRWFRSHRGRALGIVMNPVILPLFPLTIVWALRHIGLSGTYFLLAGVLAVSVLANLFVVDRPPDTAAEAAPATAADAPAGASAMSFLSSPRFWGLTIAAVSLPCGSILITSHIVPMARTWGLDETEAATLLSVQSLAGIAGMIVFGWLADRIGGLLTLAYLAAVSAALWLLLLVGVPFWGLVVLIGFIGLHAAGAVPTVGVSLSETFGRENFSAAYGLNNLLNLPFTVAAVPLASLAFTRTASYSPAIVGEAMFMVIAVPLALWVRGRTRQADGG